MFPAMNPKQMQKMMEQMGIKSSEIKAKKVIIEREDGQMVINDPQVVEITMQGQRSFQIVGTVEEKPLAREEDVKLVMERTGATKERAEQALAECKGDIAEAIMKLEGV